ncbi:MAG: hypothetical protein ACERKD_10760 [Prolixibacteraceae bacterium]
MKRTILILAVVLFTTFSVQSFAAANTLKGSTLSEFGNYSLVPSDQLVVINNVAYKTWDLTYSGTDQKYQVFYAPGNNGECCFTVRSNNFEIQYAKQLNGFGVRVVDPAKRTMKKKDIMKQIEYNQFVSQLVLTPNEKTQEEYLGIVACFMPLLFG